MLYHIFYKYFALRLYLYRDEKLQPPNHGEIPSDFVVSIQTLRKHIMKNNSILQEKPWILGPLELLIHAEGHMLSGTDLDKRLALISYDNAIELSISLFLKLHPSQRNGITYSKVDVEKWLGNYFTKLDFFYSYVNESKQQVDIKREEIIWYHQLRNEIYHSGIGLTPQEIHIQGIRRAALGVFQTLFGIDAANYIDKDIYTSRPVDSLEQTELISGPMALIRSFIEFETTLTVTIQSIGIADKSSRYPENISKSWELFSEHCKTLPNNYENIVRQSISTQDRISHGDHTGQTEDMLFVLAANLDQVTEYVSNYVFSIDILPLLKEQYGKWIRPEISEVRFINREGTVFIEIVYQKGFYTDIKLEDLSFINDFEPDNALVYDQEMGEYVYDEELAKELDKPFFSPERTAQENAELFVQQFDPYDIGMTTDLFTAESWDEIKKIDPPPSYPFDHD